LDSISLALPEETSYTTSMITNKKTSAEKQLIKFRNQLHNLLIRNPEIRIASDINGDVVAFIVDEDLPKIYLPESGKQELINK
jgi:hypothetical protein